jgi:hypothetical protein
MGCGTSIDTIQRRKLLYHNNSFLSRPRFQYVDPIYQKSRSPSAPEQFTHKIDMSYLKNTLCSRRNSICIPEPSNDVSVTSITTTRTHSSTLSPPDSSNMSVDELLDLNHADLSYISPDTKLKQHSINFHTKNIIHKFPKNIAIDRIQHNSFDAIDKSTIVRCCDCVLYLDNDGLYTTIVKEHLHKITDLIFHFTNSIQLKQKLEEYYDIDKQIVIISEIDVNEEGIGYKLLDYVTEYQQHYNVVFIILTKYVNHPLIKQYKTYEVFQDYVLFIKPISLEVLRYTIATHFEIIMCQ